MPYTGMQFSREWYEEKVHSLVADLDKDPDDRDSDLNTDQIINLAGVYATLAVIAPRYVAPVE